MKLDIIEPFEPMDDSDTTPAVKRVVNRSIESLVSQYSLIKDQIKSLEKRRSAIYPTLINVIQTQLRVEGITPDSDGCSRIAVNDKQIVLQPRKRYVLNEEAAERLFSEKNLLDSVAKDRLTYELPPSALVPKLARKIYKLIEDQFPGVDVKVQSELVFDEEAIQRCYELGELTDDEIDQITDIETIGKGFALFINNIEEGGDDDASE